MEEKTYLKKDLRKLAILVIILAALIVGVIIWDKNTQILDKVAQNFIK